MKLDWCTFGTAMGILCLLALIPWRVLRRGKSDQSSITVVLPLPTYQLYRRYAEFTGKSLENWVLLVLDKALPPDIDRKMSELQGSGLDDAFAHLDAIEEAELGFPRTSKREVPIVRRGVSKHPCLYLSSEIPAHLRPGECMGSCGAQSFKKPCQWAAHLAHNCPDFSVQVVKKPS